jgi:hypothetical protein
MSFHLKKDNKVKMTQPKYRQLGFTQKNNKNRRPGPPAPRRLGITTYSGAQATLQLLQHTKEDPHFLSYVGVPHLAGSLQTHTSS